MTPSLFTQPLRHADPRQGARAPARSHPSPPPPPLTTTPTFSARGGFMAATRRRRRHSTRAAGDQSAGRRILPAGPTRKGWATRPPRYFLSHADGATHRRSRRASSCGAGAAAAIGDSRSRQGGCAYDHIPAPLGRAATPTTGPESGGLVRPGTTTVVVPCIPPPHLPLSHPPAGLPRGRDAAGVVVYRLARRSVRATRPAGQCHRGTVTQGVFGGCAPAPRALREVQAAACTVA